MKEQDLLDKLANEFTEVKAVEFKKKLKIKVIEMEQFDLNIPTPLDTKTDIYQIIDRMRKLINDHHNLCLPEHEALMKRMESKISELDYKYGDELELAKAKAEIERYWTSHPCIQFIDIVSVQLKQQKINGENYTCYVIKYRFKNMNSWIYEEASITIVQFDASKIVRVPEPESVTQLRECLGSLFHESAVHLQMFLKALQEEKLEKERKIRLAESQLELVK